MYYVVWELTNDQQDESRGMTLEEAIEFLRDKAQEIHGGLGFNWIQIEPR